MTTLLPPSRSASPLGIFRSGRGFVYEVLSTLITAWVDDEDGFDSFLRDLGKWSRPQNWLGEVVGYTATCEVWRFVYEACPL